jgi:uncharacterized repeat protein (TIGR03803 family)
MKSTRTLATLAVFFTFVVAASTYATAQTETILDNFQADAVGYEVNENVIFDSSGNLYGITNYGGENYSGTIFEMSPAGGGTWTAPTVLLGEAGQGESPIVLNGGNIFTTAILVGFGGGVYELSPGTSGWTQTILYEFLHAPKDINEPWGNVVFDSSGNLYGTAQFGDTSAQLGGVFELTPTESGEWTESLPFVAGPPNFEYGADPCWVVIDSSNRLYVESLYGGQYSGGLVFQLTPSAEGWTKSVLYEFPYASGPYRLTLDASGNVYGITINGGTYNAGTVFKLKKNASGIWEEQILHSFGSGSDGNTPISAPVFDSAGNLYGTAAGGGSAGLGVVYKLSPGRGGSWTETILHNFLNDGVDGNSPYGGVVLGPDGNLYGTTYYGGLYGDGTIYELTTD